MHIMLYILSVYILDIDSVFVLSGLSFFMLAHVPTIYMLTTGFLKKNGNKLLALASSRGDTEMVALILNALRESGSDIPLALNHSNNNGTTALMLASEKGHTEIVQLLLNALHTAGADNIRLALNHSNNNGTTALMLASEKGHSVVVSLLIQALKEVNDDIPLTLNRADHNIFTALSYAAWFGHAAVVSLLIQTLRDASADILLALNHRAGDVGTDVLGLAANGHTAVVSLIIQTLQDINADIAIALNQVDDNDCTALMYAAEDGHKETASLLIQTYLDANANTPLALNHVNKNANIPMALNPADNTAVTALVLASVAGLTEIVAQQLKILQDANVDILQVLNGATTSFGHTALIIATEKGHTEIVQVLVNALHTADANILTALNHSNNAGWTALTYAADRCHKETASLLIQTYLNANANITMTPYNVNNIAHTSVALNHKNEPFLIALVLASFAGLTEIVSQQLKILQDDNVDIFHVFNGATTSAGRIALSGASEKGHTAVVFLLIQALQNANGDISDILLALNHPDRYGRTSLILASRKDHSEIVQLLLKALHTAGADILTAINRRSNNGMTSLRTASENGHKKIVKMLLAHGANLANANTMSVANLIASASQPTIAEEKLHVILQNGDLAWVDEDYANFDNKSKTELVSLNALASWGIIVGNESFVSKMIALKQGNLSSAELTEYLRLALQSQKFAVAQTVLKYVKENNPTIYTSTILNLLLHLIVIQRGPLSAVIFLLERGAAPENIVLEENALMAHTLFKEHTKYQIERILPHVSKVCMQKISRKSETDECVVKHLTREIEENGTNSYEGIQLEDICSRINAYSNNQSLFHRLCIENRHDVLGTIGRSMADRQAYRCVRQV